MVLMLSYCDLEELKIKTLNKLSIGYRNFLGLRFSLIPSQGVFNPSLFLQTCEALPDLKHALKEAPSLCPLIRSAFVFLSVQQEAGIDSKVLQRE